MNELPKILIVDDEKSVLKGIKLNLGRSYDITLASTANEALGLIEQANLFPLLLWIM